MYVQGDQKSTPHPTKMKKAPEKLSIAFSNRTYLDIIWRVSCSTIDFLRLNESLCKMSSIYFWTFLDVFGVITHVTYGSSKNSKKRPNWIPMGFYDYFALLSPVLLWSHCILFILPVFRQFWGNVWVKFGKKLTFLDFPEKLVISKCWNSKKLQMIFK